MHHDITADPSHIRARASPPSSASPPARTPDVPQDRPHPQAPEVVVPVVLVVVPVDVEACVNRICQDDTLAAGEQCDRNRLGGIDDCTDLGYVGGGAISTCDSLCNFNTGACTDASGASGTVTDENCGNGIIDAGEDCDWSTTYEDLPIFRDGLRCSSFNGWNKGALKCYPKGTAQQCRADTSGCSVCTGAFCGSVPMNCSLPILIRQGSNDEFVVKADGSLPGDPTYVSAANWTACSTPDLNPATPATLEPPIQSCSTLFDCVYATEAGQPTPGQNPTCYDSRNADIVANTRGEPILCSGSGFWCPQGFKYLLANDSHTPGIIPACVEENSVCDWGSDTLGYKYGCNTIDGIMRNRLRCLNDFDGSQEGSPIPDGPPYQKVCTPFRYSFGNSFKLFFGQDVKVY